MRRRYSLNLVELLSVEKLKNLKLEASIIGVFALVLLILFWQGFGERKTSNINDIPPLAMQGGNPYIRALMRTITASEAFDSNPYSLLYGGKHFSDFSRHPNQCIKIVSGPHKEECSTAAGRYQILYVTWQEKVKKYHPKLAKVSSINNHSFEPQVQDEVAYTWLNDHDVWGVDIAVLLQQGKLNQVLQILSGTWTSLGYGIENNQVTPLLSQVYQKMLAEELKRANSSSPR